MTRDVVNARRRVVAQRKRKDMLEEDRERAKARRRELYRNRNMNSCSERLPLSDDESFNTDETVWDF
ncbi:hypothetical protein Sjap_015322 [Stephania japonica]|uniref:IBB domain-containing protein n=1 Tax=Stephania japonica TaxID=461633 RepID=A0AAP0IJC8_9MAGN